MPGKWSDGQALAEYLINAESEAIRGVTFSIPATAVSVPPLYSHQKEALARLTGRPASTILHLPTGSGKTRIALEFIAVTLRAAPQTKIIWASYPTTLIRQVMVRVAQFSARLPIGLRFTWAKSDRKSRNAPTLFRENDLIFALRGTLSDLLADVGDRPKTSSIRALLVHKVPLVIIYDECHQLGARRLQRGFRAMDRKRPEGSAWPRILGLSATPLPRNRRRRILLRKTLFPEGPDAPRYRDYPWRMDVAYRVQNAALERLGVLCPVNAYQQRSGFFDLPTEVLDRATRLRPIEEPPSSGAKADDLLRFSGQFNARVMSHPLVLRFIAGRLATRIDQLGKTLVFLPTIRAANALYALLSAHPQTTGRVFIVHTKLSEMEDLPEPLEVYDQLARYAAMGSEPSVMINVNMLTTGFDEPQIRTIVLARLTYSMNLYWQMIGRGSRGPRSAGTTDCTVIDPIRLTRLYPIAAGYRPSLTQSNDHLVSGDEVGDGRLDPSLTIVERAHGGPGPGPDAVVESWFDGVVLDEAALTAYAQPPPKAGPTAPETDEVTFDSPVPLSRDTRTALATDLPISRLFTLTTALSGDALQRVATAFGIPFAGSVAREDAADELLDALLDDGRKGVSTFFEAIPSPELRALVRTLGLPTPANKKAAFIATLIHDVLLSDPLPPLKALVSPDRLALSGLPRGAVYALLDRRYDKRGLQRLLDRLNQPRSGKNKRVLIARIFETFLWRELAR
jgi:superfamily II DNA or RNA helicase